MIPTYHLTNMMTICKKALKTYCTLENGERTPMPAA